LYPDVTNLIAGGGFEIGSHGCHQFVMPLELITCLDDVTIKRHCIPVETYHKLLSDYTGDSCCHQISLGKDGISGNLSNC
jgi:hypothetical protein